MQVEDLRKFAGMPVVVQFRDAIARCASQGPARPAIAFNAEGKPLLKDGSVAPENMKSEDITAEKMAIRAVWDIEISFEEGAEGRPVFQYAFGPAMLAIEGDGAVTVAYRQGAATLEISASAMDIVAVTRVTSGPMPEEKPRIIAP